MINASSTINFIEQYNGSFAFLASLMLVCVTILYVRLTHKIVKNSDLPIVILHKDIIIWQGNKEKRRPSKLEWGIENVGKGTAFNVDVHFKISDKRNQRVLRETHLKVGELFKNQLFDFEEYFDVKPDKPGGWIPVKIECVDINGNKVETTQEVSIADTHFQINNYRLKVKGRIKNLGFK